MTAAAAAAKVLPWPDLWPDLSITQSPDSFRPAPPMLRRPRKPRDPGKPPRVRKPPVSLSDEQFLALLGKAKERRLRDWVLILFTYRHGFRASEPLGVTEADIDLREGKVFVRRGKGSVGGWQDLLSWPDNPLMDERTALEFWLANRGRFGVKGGAKADGRRRALAPVKMGQSTKIVAFSPNSHSLGDSDPAMEGAPAAPPCVKPAGGSQPLPPSSNELLDPPAAPCTPLEPLFPITRKHFWRLVHNYALAAGIPARKCKTHTLKHTIAKQLVREGHPVNEIMEWMGWRSMETMMWYIRPDEEELGQRIGNRMRAMTGLRPLAQGRLFP